MNVYEEETIVNTLDFDTLGEKLAQGTNRPIRFVVTDNTTDEIKCEISYVNNKTVPGLFSFNRKTIRNTNEFNVALLIPTGIGAEIGGHSGDGNSIARLLASSCDVLITHPNVVNASEINELPSNGLYVEGSVLTGLFMGQLGLAKVNSNKILVLVDEHKDQVITNMVINAISAARVTLGVDCDVHVMKNPIDGKVVFSKSGRATGEISKLENILGVIEKYKNDYDAFALSTATKMPLTYYVDYFKYGKLKVNPWGGYEAMLTHSIARILNVSCAHAPMLHSKEVMDLDYGIVDPRKAPEVLSTTWLYCILKGLHKSPHIVPRLQGFNIDDIDCLVIPDGCIGLPVLSCILNDMPVIAVKNKNIMINDLERLPFKKGGLIKVNNYLEAVGILNAMKHGISLESVQRPIQKTREIK